MILLLLKEWVLKRKSLFYIGRHDVLKAPLKGKEEKEALLKLQNPSLAVSTMFLL